MKMILRTIGLLLLMVTSGAVQATTEWSAADYDLYAGDFNGDGKTDILYIAKDPSMPSGIALSDGTGPNIAWQSWASNFLGINWAANTYNVIVADFNGDGKADIFLQSVVPGNNYLLLTGSTGYVVGISQTVSNSAMGLTWSADQHHIMAGAFAGSVNGHPKAGLFLQATSSSGTDAIVLSDANGMFSSASPSQTWTDGYLGFQWNTHKANVFAGDFNGDGYADLLIQAKPNFVEINYDVPFPVPTYPPNMNGVVLASATAPIFAGSGVQAWSRMSNGVDWSPLTNTIIVASNGTGPASIILQGKYSGRTSYELTGNTTGAIFPATATALSSNISMTSDGYRLIAGRFSGSGVGLYYQSLTSGGTNYVADTIAATITASVQNPSTVTSTVEPTSAGRTAAQFSVTPTGGAAYNIPLWTPPGARDIEPHLALHYTSGGPDGVMGPGWSLIGVSAIARCGKTWASTGGTATVVGSPAGVILATSDDLCLDGNRLRLTSGTQGMGGSTYITELADMSLITANGSASSAATSFTVLGKDGRYYEYGASGNSAISASGASAPYVWALDKLSDRQGNYMTYTYLPAVAIPTVSTIQYTALSGSTSYPYTVTLNYSSTRTGGTSLTKYVAGGSVTQSRQLANVLITSAVNSAGTAQTTIVRKYNLGYSASPTTSRPLLISVQECGGTSGADCIRPTTISYQVGGAGWSPTSAPTGINGQYGYIAIDLNGDGIADALYAKYSNGMYTWYAKLANGSGYGSEIATGASTALSIIPGPFNGKMQPQFLAYVGSAWSVFTFSNGAFSSAVVAGLSGTIASVLDWDGDGLPDILQNSSGVLTVRRNTTGTNGTLTFATPVTVYNGQLTGNLYVPAHQSWQATNLVDFNGDGRADLILSSTPTCTLGVNCHSPLTVLMSNGFSASPTVASFDLGQDSLVTVADWNGDGCTDIVTTKSVYASDCKSTLTAIASTPLPGAAGGVASYPALAVDWDGDGQTDLIFSNGSSWQLYRSTGNGAAAAVSLGLTISSGAILSLADVNQDGQQDIVAVDPSNAYATGYYVHNGVNTAPDFAISFSDGFGIQFNPSYVAIIHGSYTKGSSAVFPDVDFDGPMYVVNKYTASDGTGGTYQNSFTYAGARFNEQGRGFDGFSTTTSTDSRNGLIHSTAYVQGFPLIGAVAEDDIYQSDMTPISKTTNVNLSKSIQGSSPTSTCGNCYFGYIDNTTVLRYEVGGTKNGDYVSNTYTKYVYDAYGTLTSTSNTLTDTDTGAPVSPFANQQWTTVIANTEIYNNDSSTVWCLGRPTVTTTTRTAPNQPSLTRTVNHTMDPSTGGQSNSAYGNCRAQYEVVEPNTPLQVSTLFGFDSCGNTNSVAVTGVDETGAAMPVRTTTTNYGTRCQFPESVTNAYSQKSTMGYRYDLGIKQTAADPNGISISWLYDSFGRKTKESRPDGTSTIWSYTDCVQSSCWGTADLRFQTIETLYDASGNAIREHETFADGMDRIRFEEGNRVLGVWNTAVVSYDSLGRKYTEWLPYSSGGNGYHIYSYDVGNRPLSDTLYTPSGTQYRQIKMGYFGDTATIQDPRQNTITKVTDLAGKLRYVTDPPEGVHGAAAGTTIYTYDSFDNLTSVEDAIGATSQYVYNIRGFKTKSIDADTGTWLFQPDSLNELKRQTDANNAVTTFTYDLLGRMLTRLEPESGTPTSWSYGTNAAAFEIGQITSVTKPDGYKESYTYESAGRPHTKIYTEDAVNYQFDYAYNAIGAPDTLTYPTSTSGVRFALKYSYDSSGYLNAVKDNSAGTVFWALTGATDASQPTMEVLGNSVSVATGYTPWTTEMVNRSEGTGGSATNLQNLSYSWDLNGNLLQRVDNRQSLTEVFTLDALNRLSTVTLNGVRTLGMQYDQAGDIINKSDVSATNFQYSDPAHKHAVTAAGTWTIGYDANGNMNSRAGGAITSYSYNLPNQINYNGNSSQFNYDSNHQRWKQVANYSGTTETVHYIGGLLQVVTRGTSPTEYRHQIMAGSSTVVYTRRSDGTTSTYYATSDHLGSADLVMDSAANVLVRESFSPFGARRGTTWQGIPSTADYSAIQSSTRQGFTGHEMLDSVSLIHMNGRVYDPNIGRFLSADNLVSNLGATQSINPYSYTWNDPLRYTDPSGHGFGDYFGLIVDAIIGIVFTFVTYGAFGPGLFAAFASGFAGGFVSAALSTGSLSAALTAGLISGVTAAAFYEVGSFSQNAQPGHEWSKADFVLAHAAVGCGSAALSGGNCGKGAAAAALSETATQIGFIKPDSVGTWGAVKGMAEAGLVGGLSAEIVGGNFKEGFSIGAAGYLFNKASHMNPGLHRFPGLTTNGNTIQGTVPVNCDGDDCKVVMEKLTQFAADNNLDIQFRAATKWEIFRNWFTETTLTVTFVPDQDLGGGIQFGGHGGNGIMLLNGAGWMDSKSAVVAHEFGHNLGLDDSYDPHAMGSLMYGMQVPYTKDFLLPADRSELLDAYKQR